MVIQTVLVLFGLVFLAGCTTTQSAKVTPITQLQGQIADLEQRMQDQEKEVVDLKYEVKELSTKGEDEYVYAEKKQVAPVVAVEQESQPVKTSKASVEIIKVSASGTDIQKALKNAGYYEGKIDGKVGPKTKAAVVEFQKQHGLRADGVIGQKTWSELSQYLSE